MSALIIQTGKRKGKKLFLPETEVVIGRDEDCQIRLTSDNISRRHCALQDSKKGILVWDLGSQNGTFVNDRRIEGKAILKGGDRLQVGPMIFQAASQKPVPSSVDSVSSKKVDSHETMDDEIAEWLSEGDTATGISASEETRVIPVRKDPEEGDDVASPEPDREKQSSQKKQFESVAEEAADIIRRHQEKVRKRGQESE